MPEIGAQNYVSHERSTGGQFYINVCFVVARTVSSRWKANYKATDIGDRLSDRSDKHSRPSATPS